MMSTISRRLFVQIVLLLTLVSGGVGILYAYGTRALYISEQCKVCLLYTSDAADE